MRIDAPIFQFYKKSFNSTYKKSFNSPTSSITHKNKGVGPFSYQRLHFNWNQCMSYIYEINFITNFTL